MHFYNPIAGSSWWNFVYTPPLNSKSHAHKLFCAMPHVCAIFWNPLPILDLTHSVCVRGPKNFCGLRKLHYCGVFEMFCRTYKGFLHTGRISLQNSGLFFGSEIPKYGPINVKFGRRRVFWVPFVCQIKFYDNRYIMSPIRSEKRKIAPD